MEDLISANFVEVNLKLQEIMKHQMDMEKMIATLIHNLVPPKEEDDGKPIIYPI